MAQKNKTLIESVETDVVKLKLGKGAEANGKSLSSQVEQQKVRARSKSYVMDLRIHSPASLGYLGVEGLDTAPALVRLAKVKGLDVIAVTDYYSGKFVDRVVHAAKDGHVTIIPGVVIRCILGTCDDVILTCLFSENCTSQMIEEFLIALEVPQSAFGDRRYLLKLPFPDLLKKIDQFGGVALPSRMDKTPHRVSAIPSLVEDYGFRAFDVAYSDSVRLFKSRWPKEKFHLFSFSNANALAQVGSRIARVKMSLPGFEGIRELVERASI